jgi:hypothetical protein
LTTTDYAGDTNDRQLFGLLFRAQHEGKDIDEKDIEEMWGDAKADVNKDLDDESFQAEVKAKAREIMPKLYPWLRA